MNVEGENRTAIRKKSRKRQMGKNWGQKRIRTEKNRLKRIRKIKETYRTETTEGESVLGSVSIKRH